MKDNIWRYKDYVNFTKGPSVFVRRWACERLIDLYGINAKDAIAAMLNDRDEYIATSVVDFLCANNCTRWTFPILSRFRGSSGSFAGSCAAALGKMQFDDAVPFFSEKLQRIDHLDLDELFGIIDALDNLKSQQSSELLRGIAELFEDSNNGIFIARICRALLNKNQRDLIEYVVALYLKKYFALDDNGKHILQLFIQKADISGFIEEFHTFADEVSEDFLLHLKRNARRHIATIFGEEFIQRIAQKFLKNNYIHLFDEVSRNTITLLASRGINPDSENLSSEYFQELINFHFVQSFCRNKSFYEVMSVKDTKKIFIFLVCSLIRIAYPAKENSKIQPRKLNWKELLHLFLQNKQKIPSENELIEQVIQKGYKKEIISICSKIIQNEPDTCSAVRATKILGKTKNPAALPILWQSLCIDAADQLCEAAETAITVIGVTAVDFIIENFSSGDFSQKVFSLEILSKIPDRKSIRFLLKNFDELWDNYNEFLLNAIEALGSKEFLSPLRKKLTQAHPVEQTYLLLCELHNVSDPILKSICKRIQKKERESKIRKDIFAGCNSAKAIMNRLCHVKLMCRNCNLNIRNVVTIS